MPSCAHLRENYSPEPGSSPATRGLPASRLPQPRPLPPAPAHAPAREAAVWQEEEWSTASNLPFQALCCSQDTALRVVGVGAAVPGSGCRLLTRMALETYSVPRSRAGQCASHVPNQHVMKPWHSYNSKRDLHHGGKPTDKLTLMVHKHQTTSP